MSETEVRVTNHAARRIRRRLGLNKKAVLRRAQIAYDEGLRVADLKGAVKERIEAKAEALDPETGFEFVIHDRYVFLFDREVLVTAYLLTDGRKNGNTADLIRKLLKETK